MDSGPVEGFSLRVQSTTLRKQSRISEKSHSYFCHGQVRERNQGDTFSASGVLSPPNFNDLPDAGWVCEGFPVIMENAVTLFLSTLA